MRERLGKELLFLDGGMGTLLQERGLKPGELPETWNLKRKEEIIEIHRQYYEAGSDIVLSNTFGANALKFHDEDCSLREIIFAAVDNVKTARALAGKDDGRHYAALDIGRRENCLSQWEICPLTRLTKPLLRRPVTELRQGRI